VSCPLHEILKQTGERVVEFVSSVDHFSATETMNHEALNEFGLAIHSERRRFNYLVAIQEFRPGVYDVQEFRDGLTTADIFPEHVATMARSPWFLSSIQFMQATSISCVKGGRIREGKGPGKFILHKGPTSHPGYEVTGSPTAIFASASRDGRGSPPKHFKCFDWKAT